MTLEPNCLTTFLLLAAIATFSLAVPCAAQDQTNLPAPAITQAGDSSGRVFDAFADQALQAMKQLAEKLKIQGVAVVAYLPGDNVDSWVSKMRVVGSMKTESSTNSPGSNLLAIAYSKAAEMADTLKPSGSGVRPPLKGEFGWQGGWIVHGKTGYLIAAFSGGRSAEDVKVSQKGLELLSKVL